MARIARNAEALGVPGLQVICGEAPAALDGLPRPDAVFIGGGVHEPGLLEKAWKVLPAEGRLVANAVTIESEAALLDARLRFGGTLSRLSVERLSALGDFHGYRPAMTVHPVCGNKTMIVAGIGCRSGCPAEDIVSVVEAAQAQAGCRADRLAAPGFKAHEAGLIRAARLLRLDLDLVENAAMQAVQQHCPTPSVPAFAATGFALGGGSRRARFERRHAAARPCRPCTGHLRAGSRMTVHFIGAGPGAPDLITLRGRDLLARCPVCLYAGSIVPAEMLLHCPPGARLVDTAPLSLDQIEAEFLRAAAAGADVARLQSGDLSVYSAVAEQIRRLEAHGLAWTMTPGVPAFAAAAAALGCELTVPGLAQSVVLTRLSGRASAMPPAEKLAHFAASGATLAIHLAIHRLAEIVETLTPFYGAACPAAIVARASWPDERIFRGTLADIAGKLAAEPVQRTALILVGQALAASGFRESALYDAAYVRRFRGGNAP